MFLLLFQKSRLGLTNKKLLKRFCIIIYLLFVIYSSVCPGVAVAAGIYTLTGMSVDRYKFVQNPSHAIWSSARFQALMLTSVIWLISIALMSPLLYVRTVDIFDMPNLTPMTFCIEKWPSDRDRQIFGWLVLIVLYVIPVSIVVVCYARVGRVLCFYALESPDVSIGAPVFRRRRALRIVVVLVGLFICCWLPYNIMSLMIDQGDMIELTRLYPFALWLGHAHSAVNPALYWATNRRSKEVIIKLYKKCIRKSTERKKRWPRRI